MNTGYVYAIIDYNDEVKMPNTVKFGVTTDKNISNRLKSLQTGNPHRLSIAAAIGFNGHEFAQICERLIHNKFKDKRLSGEWFKYDLEIEEFLDFGFPHFGEPLKESEMGLVRKCPEHSYDIKTGTVKFYPKSQVCDE